MTEFRYEWDKVEDVAEGIKAGRRIFKDRVVCRFFKPGGDIVLTAYQDGKLNPAFEKAHFVPRSTDKIDFENAAHMRQVFDDFMKAGEISEKGFPVREWAAITRAEAENLIGLGLTTLEKLASASDEVLKGFTGGVILKNKAQAWLDDAKDKGIMANKHEQLKKELDVAQETIASLKKELQAARNQIEALTAKAVKEPKEK